MSEFKTKTIQRVDIKSQPWGNQGYFAHKYFFTDGTKGEAYKCKEPNPEWMKAGKTIQFQEEPSQFANCPFIIPIEHIEQVKALQEAKSAETSHQTNTYSNSKYQNKNNYKSSGWTPRFEDSPPVWACKQRFISLYKLYEILGRCVETGKLEYGNLEKEVDKHLEHIIEKSGMKNLSIPVAAPIGTSNSRSFTPAAKHIQVASEKKDAAHVHKSELLHTSQKQEDNPNVSPEAYFTEPPELFAEEEKVFSEEPAPKDILEKIGKCTKLAQLKKIHQNLTVEQLKNKGIVDAYFAQKNKLTKKK